MGPTRRKDDGRPEDLEVFLGLDDDALRAALDARFGDAGRAGERLAGGPGAEAFGAACRAALGDDDGGSAGSEALRERRIVQRVLARTTREDLRRRADLGLVIDFMAERLRRSALLRVAAALLLLQLTVVPLVALHLAKRPQVPALEVRIEPAPEVFDDLPERDESSVEGGLEALVLEEIGGPVELAAELRRALGGALDLTLDGPSGAEPAGAEGRALGHYAAALRGEAPPAPRIPGPGPLAAWALLEARLLVLVDHGDAAGLARAIDDAAAAHAGATGAGRALVGRALDRAAAMHLAVPLSAAAGPGRPDPSGLVGDLLRLLEGVDGPVARAWRGALAR